ncbi:MAG: cation-translocating P-type ATPase [Pseudomonadales bacterium]
MTVSTISVRDMHCASCVGRIERHLEGVKGIVATHINPARRLVLVEHASDTDPVSLLQLIEDAGFQPSLARIDRGSAGQRDLLKRLGIAGLAMMQVMMFAIALYAGAFTGMDEAYRRLLELASLAFCIPVVAYSAMPFFHSALSAFGHRRRGAGLSMDVPIALAIAAAFAVSLAHTLSGAGEVYYDSVVMFTFLLLAARYVDDRLKARFEDANASLGNLPEQALVRDAAGSTRPRNLAQIEPGSLVWVEQGNRVPLDGTVVRGTATLDESALTGESTWVRRLAGEAVFAGTLNQGAGFELRTTATADATRMAGIAELAARAQAGKAPLARLADRIAARFVPAVLALAAVTWLAWQLVDPERAFVAALTVLVVSCPCALSLATPAAVTAALTRLRQNGAVLTRSDALEQIASVDAAIVDKTGTLTAPDPQLDGVTWLAASALSHDRLLALTAALERHANHPLARAFARACPDAEPGALSDVTVIPGAGVSGRFGDTRLKVGHAAFCGAPEEDARAVFLTVDDVPVARFDIADPVRADAAAAIRGLQAAGLEVTMISGDAVERCAELASELGIDFAARQSPETKLEITRALQQRGRRVLVVGDGINDVPALAAADVSATVLESSDLVKSKADVLLLSRRLGALVDLVHIGRRARRIVRQNLFWALTYNLTAVPIAALGLMPPWLAALGMASSSVLVMSNAARLLGRAGAD